MRCGSCGCLIERQEDIAWVQGNSICPECAIKGRALRRTLFTVWLVAAILIVVIPMVLCAGGVVIIRNFQ